MRDVRRHGSALLPIALVLLLAAAPWSPGRAQETGAITGTISSVAGAPVAGAQVSIATLNRGTITRADGAYLLPGLPAGTYTLQVDMLGYKSVSEEVTVSAGATARQNFTLSEDLLNMEALVVTGTQAPRVQVQAPVAVSIVTPKEIEQANPRSTTEMLRYVPGFTRVESSGGEVNENITMRGILGVEYVMFMEDGLPVFPTMHTFFMNADNLFRPDENIYRMEVVRGGSSALFGSNTPGAIVNFINKPGGPDLRGTMKATTGTEGLARYDGNVSGPLGENWRFNLGGFYRYDHGVRDPGLPGIRGGQFKGSVTRLLENGHIRASVKVIDDRNQFVLPLPFRNPSDPSYVAGFSKYGSMNTAEGNHISVPTPEGNQLDLPLDDGLRTQAYWLTANALFEFGEGWMVENSAQLMSNNQGWNAILPFNVFTADAGVADFLNGYGSSIQGALVSNGTLPAGADSIRFAGVQPGANYSLYYTNHFDNTGAKAAYDTRNGLIAPSGEWHVEKPISAFQDQLQLKKALGEHTISAGLYFANYTQTNRWYFTEILTDVRDNPRFLDLMINDATLRYNVYQGGTQTSVDYTLNDFQATQNGFRRFLSNYVNGSGQTTVVSGTLGGSFQVMDRLRADIGGRWEMNDFVQTSENTTTVDEDGNPLTRTDNASWGDGSYRHFSKTMNDWAASLGLNYELTDNLSLYALGSRAYKMPALDEFLTAQAAAQVDLFDSREVQSAEGGVKFANNLFGLTVNGFYVKLKNIVSQGAVTDPNTGEITWTIQTAPQNVSKGVEFELAASPMPALSLIGSGTFLKSELGKGAGADIGSWINGVPKFIGNGSATYDVGRLRLLGDVHYVGSRFADVTNDIKLKAYTYANFGATLGFPSQGVSVSGNVLNAFQSYGFEEGNPRVLAGTGGDLFLARPILPRRFVLSMRYDF